MRSEPFQMALITLRDQLRNGAFAPGTRLPATLIAQDLRLSATPVREALARLTGEGAIEERRGQGFFVRTLSAADIADLHRLSLAQLLIAQSPHPPALRLASASVAPDPDDASSRGEAAAAVRAERLFARWVAEGGGRCLVRAHLNLQVQLGPARRLEHLVFPDLDAEMADLEGAAAPAARRRLLRRFHRRRVQTADRLALLLGR